MTINPMKFPKNFNILPRLPNLVSRVTMYTGLARPSFLFNKPVGDSFYYQPIPRAPKYTYLYLEFVYLPTYTYNSYTYSSYTYIYLKLLYIQLLYRKLLYLKLLYLQLPYLHLLYLHILTAPIPIAPSK